MLHNSKKNWEKSFSLSLNFPFLTFTFNLFDGIFRFLLSFTFIFGFAVFVKKCSFIVNSFNVKNYPKIQCIHKLALFLIQRLKIENESENIHFNLFLLSFNFHFQLFLLYFLFLLSLLWQLNSSGPEKCVNY